MRIFFEDSDNLSRTLQKSSLSAVEAQHLASLTVSTLCKMCTEESFRAFFDLVEYSRNLFNVERPSLPRRKKVPMRIEDENCGDSLIETVEEYFGAVELAVTSIKDRFDQPGYAVYRNLEELLLKGIAGNETGLGSG